MTHFVARLCVSFLCIVFFLPTNYISLASDAEVNLVAQYRQDVEVSLDLSSGAEISTLDPAIASDYVSINPIQNLFLGLTDIDPVSNEVRPELATNWTISDDGLSWRFHLRNDVNWMRYDPATGEAETLRPVVAEDFVYGIKRACDPRLGGYNGSVIASVIEGCNVVNLTPDEDVTDELVFGDTTRIFAIDETTLEIRLQFSAGYFLSMTTMAVMSPLPQEVLDEYDDRNYRSWEWEQPGIIVTNGPFLLEENVRGVRRSFVRNEALPAALAGGGNVDHITYTVIEDTGTAFALYQDNLQDSAGVPPAELQSVLESDEYADQVHLVNDLAVFYFGFNNDKPPFDNVHVRRAFSAIVDREAFVEQIRQGRGVPMIHFTPPGMVNSPPIDDIGVGFDPDYAREQLDLGGYPDCVGFPTINILTYIGAGAWAELWAADAALHLGCDPALFNIEQRDSRDPCMCNSDCTPCDGPFQDFPHAQTLGWAADYPDSHPWIRDVLHCEADRDPEVSLWRTCGEIDDLMDAAAREVNPERRAELYLELEDRLFGDEGEFPIAPIYVRARYDLFKTWYTGPIETDGLFGGRHWEAYSIDMAAKLAAREE